MTASAQESSVGRCRPHTLQLSHVVYTQRTIPFLCAYFYDSSAPAPHPNMHSSLRLTVHKNECHTSVKPCMQISYQLQATLQSQRAKWRITLGRRRRSAPTQTLTASPSPSNHPGSHKRTAGQKPLGQSAAPRPWVNRSHAPGCAGQLAPPPTAPDQ